MTLKERILAEQVTARLAGGCHWDAREDLTFQIMVAATAALREGQFCPVRFAVHESAWIRWTTIHKRRLPG